jgi:predicted NBD/HSP70 family sugar kinase
MATLSEGSPGGNVNPGSQTALRQSNQQRIIQNLLSNGPSTQAELSRQTGLSTATISNIVTSMVARGIVTTERVTSSGRRAVSVSLSGHGAVSVGVDIGRTHVRLVVASIGYRVLAEDSVSLPLGHEANMALDVVSGLLTSTLVRAGIGPTSVLGVGIGIPGPIDRRTHTVISGGMLPEWVGINLLDLGRRLKYPIFIDNDANLGALSEITWGPHRAVRDLIFVKIGTGIGAGLILNGALYTGNIGVGGEIGHIPLYDHGLICRCGNRGCLETVASTAIMIELLSRNSRTPVSTMDIVDLARRGDTATLRLIDDAGLAVGRAIATMANVLNPETIVIGGPLAGLGDILRGPIQRGFARFAIPIITETTDVVMSSSGDRTEALGAAALVLREAGIRIIDT